MNRRSRGFLHVYTQIVLLTIAGAVVTGAMAAVLQVILVGIAVF